MGLSKAINLFELCLWFMANFRENMGELVETLQTSVNED